MSEIRTQIYGEFTGYHGGAVFRLANGQVWQQARYRYRYRYRYRPHVRIYPHGGGHLMEVDCMDEPIEVVRASIVTEGQIVSDFRGFRSGSVFEFSDRSLWKQTDHTYAHHYAYRPDAMIVDGRGGQTLHVGGMSETVEVRRTR